MEDAADEDSARRALANVKRTQKALDERKRCAIAQARATGLSWAQIGLALGESSATLYRNHKQDDTEGI